MVAYEFSTQLTDNGTVIIPQQYRRTLSKHTPVRVILLVEEEIDGQSDKEDLVDEPTLEQVIAKIQQLGPSQTKVTPASGLLGQHLSELMEERDPTFNLAEWQREWEQIESAINADEAAHEQAEWGTDRQ